MLLDVGLLRLRRPIHNKPSGYLRFAVLATKPGEISGLRSDLIVTLATESGEKCGVHYSQGRRPVRGVAENLDSSGRTRTEAARSPAI